jgi:orotidine-5'-phosphate decarboxylase
VNFCRQLETRTHASGSFVCVGLDTDSSKLPAGQTVLSFNRAIIDATHDLVCAYKMNSAFYEADGPAGIEALQQTFAYINEYYPDIPTILDAKRADIGNTNNAYAKFAFDYLDAGSITIHPYVGREALTPFLDHKDRGIIILCHTSNPGAGELQELVTNGKPLYQLLAENIRDEWNYNHNCLLVIGATYPEQLAEVRKLVGDDIPFLVPGIGSQGGDAEKTVKAGINSRGTGLIINSSRDIIYASNGPDFAEAARDRATKLHNTINKAKGES